MKARTHWLFIACAGILVLTSLACSIGGLSARNPEVADGPASGLTQAEEIVLNGASLDGIRATNGEQTFGPILSIQVTNPTSGEVVATVPCGLTFLPAAGSDEQALMVILEASALVPPGETVVLEPYVICIESDNSVPDTGSTYQMGSLTTGNLYDLAACLCQDEEARTALQNPLAFQDQYGIQLAVWMTADNISIDSALEAMQGGEGSIGELAEALRPMMEGIGQLTERWLERCGIQITP